MIYLTQIFLRLAAVTKRLVERVRPPRMPIAQGRGEIAPEQVERRPSRRRLDPARRHQCRVVAQRSMARIPEQPPRGGEQRDHALIVGGRSTDPFRQCRALRRTPGV